MSDWISLLATEPIGGEPVVRVAVASVRGSTPREGGACMLVSARTCAGSIGGGKLELSAIEAARALLVRGEAWQLLHVPLGPKVGQCCGGVVDLWLERLDIGDRSELIALHDEQQYADALVLATIFGPDGFRQRMLIAEDGRDAAFGDETLDTWAQREAAALHGAEAATRIAIEGPYALLLERFESAGTPLIVFGAGHVGKALVTRLGGVPFDVTWIDSRDGMFVAALPANVRAVQSSDPVAQVRGAPPGAAYLVMTHSHALDFDLCHAILTRDDVCFVGLIGSHTKAARFAHRLAREGMAAERIARLVCPIGVAGIASKRPDAIAIGVAAQLLRLREAKWDGAGAHERGRAPAQAGEAQPAAVPIALHRPPRRQ